VRRMSLVFVVCAGFFPVLRSAPIAAAPASPRVAEEATTAQVLRVVDGDTVVVACDSRPVTVRLIGVDTPETVHPRKPVERFGREASAFLKTLLDGKSVRLEYEPGPSRMDRYGRTLAYLYLEAGGLCVNREIIARGFGHAYTRYPFTFLDDFRAAERGARQRQLGLWGDEPKAPEPASEGLVFITRTGKKYHRAGCRYLTEEATSLPLDAASAQGAPCSVCDPPTTDFREASAQVADNSP
jgi:micrococcal nuclease